MKRIFLFILTNILVVGTLSIIASIFGIGHYLTANGLDYTQLFVFSLLFGMGGSFISLLISKPMAKFMVSAKTLKNPQNSQEAWLLSTVDRLARIGGIKTPELAIFPSTTPNAFATGASKDNALVAVSNGLLNNMNQDEIEAVLGHELTHVINGDMITLTLIQGVLNTFVIFLSRVAGYFIDKTVFQNSRGNGFMSTIILIVLQIVFGLLASLVLCYFSRGREFKADAGSAKLSGKRKMISALQKLQTLSEKSQLPKSLTAFGLVEWHGWLLTHPSLDKRIAALKTLP